MVDLLLVVAKGRAECGGGRGKSRWCALGVLRLCVRMLRCARDQSRHPALRRHPVTAPALVLLGERLFHLVSASIGSSAATQLSKRGAVDRHARAASTRRGSCL